MGAFPNSVLCMGGKISIYSSSCPASCFALGLFPVYPFGGIQDMLPYNDYFEYYGPDYRLHMPTSNMENMNKRETLEEVRSPTARSKLLSN